MEPPPAVSKNQQKRLKRQAAWLDTLAERKKLKKEKKARKREEQKGLPKEPKPPLLIKADREEWVRRRDGAMRLIIDCEFDSLLTDKERGSLKQQIMYSYSAIRKSAHPCRLLLSGLSDWLFDSLSKVSQGNWEAEMTKSPYISLIPPSELVYLTADSENTLTSFDPTKSYVIGGLVDHNRLKLATITKATAQNIPTAKLPLADHLELLTTKVLTVNHVVEIIVKFGETGDWGESLITVLPDRKKAKIREVGQEEEEKRGKEGENLEESINLEL